MHININKLYIKEYNIEFNTEKTFHKLGIDIEIYEITDYSTIS